MIFLVGMCHRQRVSKIPQATETTNPNILDSNLFARVVVLLGGMKKRIQFIAEYMQGVRELGQEIGH